MTHHGINYSAFNSPTDREIATGIISSLLVFGIFSISVSSFKAELNKLQHQINKKQYIISGLSTAATGSCLLWHYATGTYLTETIPELPKPCFFAAGIAAGLILGM